jgi:hypothetical protein
VYFHECSIKKENTNPRFDVVVLIDTMTYRQSLKLCIVKNTVSVAINIIHANANIFSIVNSTRAPAQSKPSTSTAGIVDARGRLYNLHYNNPCWQFTTARAVRRASIIYLPLELFIFRFVISYCYIHALACYNSLRICR